MRNDRNLELKEARAQQTKQRITKQAFANGSTGCVYYAAKDRTAFVKSARFALKSCWLKINDDFGKMPTLERTFSSLEDVVEISGDVVKFCENNRVDKNLATMAGVVTEELGSFDYQNTAGINTSIVELRC